MADAETYWFDKDGDDEPTLWRWPEDTDNAPLAVMRRCDNAEVFDLLERLLDGDDPRFDDPAHHEHMAVQAEEAGSDV